MVKKGAEENTRPSPNGEFVKDSGCLYHMTSNDSLLSELRKHDKEIVIVTSDATTHPVEQEAVVRLVTSLQHVAFF